MNRIEEYSRHIYNTAFFTGLMPEENLTTSEWADQRRVLTSVASAEPGPWRTMRVPYSKKIMDSLSPSNPIQKVVLMKGRQVAGSEIGNNFVGCAMDIAPGPMTMLLPNDRMCERASKMRISPMIENCDSLAKKVREKRNNSTNTILTKEFPGGVLVLVSAKSSANIRMIANRYIYGDEIDEFPFDVNKQGDPIEIITASTNTYSTRKKIYLCSTPTIKGKSRIEREFLLTDQQYYFVPCPECQHKQTLRFENLKYEVDENDNVKEVYYVCEECGCIIDEHHKTWMLEHGEWQATNGDGDPNSIGFHLNSLYSPVGWLGWKEIATKWRKSQNDTDSLKAFMNTVLGKTWEMRGEAPAWQKLYRQRENYKQGTVQKGGLFLTAGCDVQKDRLEIEVVAWGRDKESWSVDYHIIPGDTATLAPWQKLDEYLDYPFPHESGLNMFIMRLGVDSGYNTQQVYQYCRQFNDTLRVVATKGQESLQTAMGHPKAVELSVTGEKMRRSLKLWLIGTSVLKSELYRHLRQEPPLNEGEPFPYGYCHFPQYAEEFFKGITAEDLITDKDSKGFAQSKWVKRYDRNEPLDCRVIARAMAASLGYDRMSDAQFEKLEKQLQKQAGSETANVAPLKPGGIRKIRRRGIRSRGLN